MQKKKNSSSLKGLIPVLLLIGATFVFLGIQSNNGNNKLSQAISTPQAALILTINIDGDSDFLSQASSYSWNGTGAVSNPLIISNFVSNMLITDNTSIGISIKNVDLYFTVIGCNLTNGAIGIYLENVTHASVLSNIISNTANASIEINGCNSPIVWNNTLQTSLNDGIDVSSTPLCNITMNSLSNIMHFGLEISSSNNFTIENNIIVMNNTGDHEECAQFDSAKGGLMEGNIMNNATDTGAWFTSGDSYNTIIYNNFSYNTYVDLRFEALSSSYNNVSFNNFFNVTSSGGAMVLGEYGCVENFTNNYYFDANTTDCNGDGISDISYTIMGASNSPLNVDPKPYIFPVGSNGKPMLPANYNGTTCPTTTTTTNSSGGSSIDGFSMGLVTAFIFATVSIITKRIKSKQIH